MRTYYWPGVEPEGEAKSLLVKCLLPAEDNSYPHPEMGVLKKWCEENHWKQRKPNCIIVSCSDWQSQPSHALLGDDVTVETVANFMLSGMRTWDQVLPWWAAYLTHLTNLGYERLHVAMDIEGPQFTRGWQYNYKDEPNIKMLDVIDYMYADPANEELLPTLNLEDLNEDYVWGDWKNKSAMVSWSRFASGILSRKLTEVFWEKTTAQFDSNILVSNYDHVMQDKEAAPLTDPRNNIPHAKPMAGNSSAPLLYLSNDTWYANNAHALCAFDHVADPKNATAWVGSPSRNGGNGDWKQSPEQHAELINELKARSCGNVMVF